MKTLPRRVLITGHEGFTGRYLSCALNQSGFEVCGVGICSDEGKKISGALDLTDARRVATVLKDLNPDYVVHLAGISFVRHENVADIYNTNIVGTWNLLDALAKYAKNCRRVIIPSSSQVYCSSSGPVYREGSDVNPLNDYAISKLAVEYVAKNYISALPITIVRPFNYTGVGQSVNFVVPKIVEHFKKRRKFIELGNVDIFRDISDVRDVVEVYRRLLLSSDVSGSTYNICAGVSVSLESILAICSRLTGHGLKVEESEALVRSNEAHTIQGDPSALQSVIGELNRYSIENTLGWMIAG
jgi:GDP-6-deoxy-D-talose 4-dehydrogenase